MKKVTFIYKTRSFFDFFLIFDEFSSILLLLYSRVFAKTIVKARLQNLLRLGSFV